MAPEIALFSKGRREGFMAKDPIGPPTLHGLVQTAMPWVWKCLRGATYAAPHTSTVLIHRSNQMPGVAGQNISRTCVNKFSSFSGLFPSFPMRTKSVHRDTVVPLKDLMTATYPH